MWASRNWFLVFSARKYPTAFLHANQHSLHSPYFSHSLSVARLVTVLDTSGHTSSSALKPFCQVLTVVHSFTLCTPVFLSVCIAITLTLYLDCCLLSDFILLDVPARPSFAFTDLNGHVRLTTPGGFHVYETANSLRVKTS